MERATRKSAKRRRRRRKRADFEEVTRLAAQKWPGIGRHDGEQPRQAKKKTANRRLVVLFGAGDEARTRYLDLGKVALYQMSYARKSKIHYSGGQSVCQPLISTFSKLFR